MIDFEVTTRQIDAPKQHRSATVAQRKHRCGVSLIEFVVWVLGVGVFFAITAPNLSISPQQEAHKTLASVRDALEIYQAVHGRFPAADFYFVWLGLKLKDDFAIRKNALVITAFFGGHLRILEIEVRELG